MLNKILKILKDELNLNHYDVYISIRKSGENYTDIRVEQQYLRAFIKLSDNVKKDEFIEVIAHELCHIITEPLYLSAVAGITNSSSDYLETIREQTTEHIARVFLKNNKKRIEKLLNKD